MAIKLLSASAGSGKTFHLSMFYIHLALQDDNNFEKILALTFTNAAVSEMKNRILEKLYELSCDKKKTLNEYKEFVEKEYPNKKIEPQKIKDKANVVLQNIVYKHYNFSIFTIDSFLQKVLTSCLLELGISTNFRLLVDVQPIIDKTIEDFLLSTESEDTVLEWINKFIEYRIRSEKNINLKANFIKLAEEISKEFFYFHQDAFKNQEFDRYNKATNFLDEKQDNFVSTINEFSSRFVDLCNRAGLSAEDFIQGKRGIGILFSEKFNKFKKGDKIFDIINTKIFENFIESGEWITKSNKEAIKKFEKYQSEFKKLWNDLKIFFDNEKTKYETYRIIHENIYNIGLIHKIVQIINLYKSANSVILLSDVAKMLVDFINANYLFLYEKLGVKYEYFLIDEFQDTSQLQYKVLKPLIEESISYKGSETNVLLVGDVKQAIYRWRNGDWELMSNNIIKDFSNNIQISSLDENWRSAPNIINFNNILFKHIIEKSNIDLIKQNYKDLIQKFPSKKSLNNQGYVKILFTEKQKKTDEPIDDENNVEESWLINEIKQLKNKNINQIGILVRRNSEAKNLFQLLSQYPDIISDLPVVSKESITYKNSNLIECIIFLLHYYYTSSALSLFTIKNLFDKMFTLSNDDKTKLIDTVTAELRKNIFMPIISKIELIYYILIKNQNIEEYEKIFYFNFLSLVMELDNEIKSNEMSFINWYLTEGRDKTIQLISKEKGIYIETIHSSKGLQYDAVIVPYVNWSSTQSIGKTDYLWAVNNVSELKKDLSTLLLVSKKELENTHFSNYYLTENNKKLVDDLNLLYVAFTRAKDVLICNVDNTGVGELVIDIFNTNEFLNDIININGSDCNIKDFKKDSNYFEFGNLIELHEKKIIIDNNIDFKPINFEIISFNNNLSLILKKEVRSEYQKQLQHGKIIHKILESINKIDKWEEITNKIMNEHNIPKIEQEKIKEKIMQLFNDKNSLLYKWYKEASKIYSERTIISNEKKYRPDKIFILKDKTIIVDFKTGDTEFDFYKNQVTKYASLLKSMNYPTVEAYILNVDSNDWSKIDV